LPAALGVASQAPAMPEIVVEATRSPALVEAGISRRAPPPPAAVKLRAVGTSLPTTSWAVVLTATLFVKPVS